MNRAAVIVFHKQATSARTRFLRGPQGCVFRTETAAGAAAHPGGLLQQVAQQMGIAPAVLALAPDFRQTDPDYGEVYLVQVTATDPPSSTGGAGYRFVSLMEARDLPQGELELLGAAYGAVLEG